MESRSSWKKASLPSWFTHGTYTDAASQPRLYLFLFWSKKAHRDENSPLLNISEKKNFWRKFAQFDCDLTQEEALRRTMRLASWTNWSTAKFVCTDRPGTTLYAPHMRIQMWVRRVDTEGLVTAPFPLIESHTPDPRRTQTSEPRTTSRALYILNYLDSNSWPCGFFTNWAMWTVSADAAVLRCCVKKNIIKIGNESDIFLLKVSSALSQWYALSFSKIQKTSFKVLGKQTFFTDWSVGRQCDQMVRNDMKIAWVSW